MGHVHHEVGAAAVGNLAEAFEVDGTGIGRGAGHDELRAVLFGQGLHLVVVNALGGVVQPVGDDFEVAARDIDRAAVGKMAAVVEAHAKHGVARLEQGKKDGQIGVCAAVGLDVGMVGAKELAGALAGDALGDVNFLAAAVIASAGIALGILVGQAGAHGDHHSLADNVFRGDELDVALLTRQLGFNGGPDLRITLVDKIHNLSNHCLSLSFVKSEPRARRPRWYFP